MTPLDSAYRKIARAREHLTVLGNEVRAFTDAKPYGLATDVDDEGAWHVRFEVRAPIPASWSLIAGDVVHNARSALDHVVYQLALHNGGSGETNGFPIFDDPKKYRDHAARLLKNVTEPALMRIEGLQPYHVVCTINPKAFAPEFQRHMYLYMLGRLDDLDKHRLLLSGMAVSRVTAPRFRGVRYARGQFAGEGRWVRVEQGAELFTITELELSGDPREVRMDPEPTYSIGFGDAEFTAEELWTNKAKGHAGLGDFRAMLAAAEQTIATFADVF